MKKLIKYLVMDVDGTLTDGKIYMGNNGEVMKAFNAKDGCGINMLLPKSGIKPVILTSRQSDIVVNRCNELGIDMVFQGIREKAVELRNLSGRLGTPLSQFAYIGDDLNDLQCLSLIKEQGGITACPADADAQVRETVDYVCTAKGGDGAVREFISFLLG